MLLLSEGVAAQLPNGSTVPDFTFTDDHGVSQHLYAYLNQGKVVALDVSATWNQPSWTYHRTGIMDSLYVRHDDAGDKKWKVLFIENDGYTDSLDLWGLSPLSQGDWFAGTLFPIIDPPEVPALDSFNAGYHIDFYPMLYLICPNKKVYQDTLNRVSKASIATWEYVASHCGPAGIDEPADASPVSVYPNPAGEFTDIYFLLNNAATVTITASDMYGREVMTRDFGRLQPGDQRLRVATAGWRSGIYFLRIGAGNGHEIVQKLVVR